MVEIKSEYLGALRCTSEHGPSGAKLLTDAPLDNHGRGEAFSPTDLVGTALGTCILTTMGIVAERHGWTLAGAKATVKKHMLADPVRRIGKLEVELFLPGEYDARQRETLERTAHTCPVHKSLDPRIEVPLVFHWGKG